MPKVKHLTPEFLETILPHGSGIDYDWEFIVHKNGKVTCKNYFHSMDEWGGYDGCMPFKFTVFMDADGRPDFNRIICNDNRRVSFFGLKDYLEETIDYALRSVKCPLS